MTSPQQRFRRHRRCPVCGGCDDDPRGQSKRCYGFLGADGKYAHCSREDLAGPLEAEGGGTYAHRLEGPCRCGQTHGESTSDVRPSLREPEAIYPYVDELGALQFEVVRLPGKQFRQRSPDGCGGYVWKINGARRVLYRLPELLDDDGDRPVYVVEGEKDVETLRRHGLTATCNPGGAGKWHHVRDCAVSALAGRHVVVIADADDVGRKHARDVRASLVGVAASVRVAECGPHKDAADLYGAGKTIADLVWWPEPAAADASDAPFAVDAPALEAPRIVLLDGAALAAPLPEIDYLVREIALVAGGGAPHLLAGYGFSGKTVAAQSLALSLASGTTVWGAHHVRDHRRVLHVDLEQGDRLTRRRYQRLAAAQGIDLAGLGDGLSVAVMPALSLDDAHEQQWRDLMSGRDLVIVDSLRAATAGCDENSSEIRGGLDMLGRVSESTGCRPWLIHHARKPSDDAPAGRYSIRGSSAIFDGVDGAYLFSASRGEPVMVEHVKSRSHGDLIEHFALVISDVDIGGDPRAGLRVQLRGAELVSEQRERTADATREARARRDADTLRRAIGATPGAGTRALRGSTGLSGDRYAAAIAALGDEVELREERRGRALNTYHYLRARGGQ